MAELADAYGSGPYFREEVQVQFLSGAPQKARFYRAFFFFLNLNCWHTHNLGVETSCIFTTNLILLNYAIIIISKSLRSCVCQLILTLQYEIMFHTAFSINFIMFCEFGFEINFYPQLFITLIYLDFIN